MRTDLHYDNDSNFAISSLCLKHPRYGIAVLLSQQVCRSTIGCSDHKLLTDLRD
jgi:hypothetical protein